MFERFYQARNGNGFAFGTHCWSADLSLYEICGHLGYDYIWIDNEHGGMTLPMIYGGIVAANASGAAAIVRVPGHGVEARVGNGTPGDCVPHGEYSGGG